MDLQPTLRVLGRFRLLVGAGFVLAALLAVMAYGSVGFSGGKPHVTPRKSPVWASTTSLQLTQQGFPAGRTVLPNITQKIDGAVISTPRFADTGRLAFIANMYSKLASSDQIVREVWRQSGVLGKIQAVPEHAPDGSGMTLPIIDLSALASSPDAAKRMETTAIRVFQTYLARNSDEAGIPPDQRVTVMPLERTPPQLLQKPKKTLPIAVFLAVMVVTVGLAFVLENLRPRPVKARVSDVDAPPAQRLTA